MYRAKEIVIKLCKHCKKEFKTNRKCRRFCCDKCRNANWIQSGGRKP